MELSEAAFKSRLHRARLSVRAAVEGYVAEEDAT
jgi:DNA-directed RNA polymerase specialized sigma24 family protein